MMVSGASKKKNRAGGLRSCNKPKEEWLGSSKVLGLLRSDLKSALFIFDLQHNKIIEENIGGISWNMSDSLVVRDTSIYATGVFMDPDRYSYPAPDKRDIDFFHLGTSVLDLNNNNNNKKWKEFAKMPPSTGTLQRPSSPILGHNIYVFQGTKALVYDINKDKWENLSHPPELLESRKSIIASYGRPLSRPELDSIQDPITIRHPVISDTINNRLLVNFWYDLYAYYPDNEHGSKWECLTRTKLGTPTICFRRPALVQSATACLSRRGGTHYSRYCPPIHAPNLLPTCRSCHPSLGKLFVLAVGMFELIKNVCGIVVGCRYVRADQECPWYRDVSWVTHELYIHFHGLGCPWIIETNLDGLLYTGLHIFEESK
ncbi:hypothetical protein P8452_72682 [Trifolium repens]|nr:hypothetical protein P8452_72682 [Trifolium repens]